MFLQGFSGVKEIIEPELAGFSTCCARVLGVHQRARRSAAAMRFGQWQISWTIGSSAHS